MTTVRVSIERATRGAPDPVRPLHARGPYGAAWFGVRQDNRPAYLARLKQSVRRKYHLTTLTATGAWVVARTLFFKNQPVNRRFCAGPVR